MTDKKKSIADLGTLGSTRVIALDAVLNAMSDDTHDYTYNDTEYFTSNYTTQAIDDIIWSVTHNNIFFAIKRELEHVK